MLSLFRHPLLAFTAFVMAIVWVAAAAVVIVSEAGPGRVEPTSEMLAPLVQEGDELLLAIEGFRALHGELPLALDDVNVHPAIADSGAWEYELHSTRREFRLTTKDERGFALTWDSRLPGWVVGS